MFHFLKSLFTSNDTPATRPTSTRVTLGTDAFGLERREMPAALAAGTVAVAPAAKAPKVDPAQLLKQISDESHSKLKKVDTSDKARLSDADKAAFIEEKKEKTAAKPSAANPVPSPTPAAVSAKTTAPKK